MTYARDKSDKAEQRKKAAHGDQRISKSRAKPSTPEVKAQRIQTIVAEMRALTWVSDITAPAFAREWGLAIDTIQDMAAEAHRIVARDMDPDAVRETVMPMLASIMRTGRDRDRLHAADIAAKLVGIYAAQRIELSSERASFEALAPAEKAVRLREKARECLAAAEQIEASLAVRFEVRSLQAGERDGEHQGAADNTGERGPQEGGQATRG